MSKRARTERRKMQRDAVKDAQARLKLASLEAGGSAERPIDVTSASTIEVHAASQPCVVCGGAVRVEEHVATTVAGVDGTSRRLRVVHVMCTRCGVRREVFFRIGTTLPS